MEFYAFQPKLARFAIADGWKYSQQGQCIKQSLWYSEGIISFDNVATRY